MTYDRSTMRGLALSAAHENNDASSLADFLLSSEPWRVSKGSDEEKAAKAKSYARVAIREVSGEVKPRAKTNVPAWALILTQDDWAAVWKILHDSTEE